MRALQERNRRDLEPASVKVRAFEIPLSNRSLRTLSFHDFDGVNYKSLDYLLQLDSVGLNQR
jgi:hypothetical protein